MDVLWYDVYKCMVDTEKIITQSNILSHFHQIFGGNQMETNHFQGFNCLLSLSIIYFQMLKYYKMEKLLE